MKIKEIKKRTLTRYLLELPDDIPFHYNKYQMNSQKTCDFFQDVLAIKGVKKVKYDFIDKKRFYVTVHEHNDFNEIKLKIDKLREMKF